MEGTIFYFECNGAHWLQADEISEITLFTIHYSVNRELTQFFIFDEGFAPSETSNLSPYYMILQGEDFPRIWYPEENMRMVQVGLWLIWTTEERRPTPSSVVIEEAAAAIARRRAQAAEAIQARIQEDDRHRQCIRDIRGLRSTLKYLQDEIQRLSIGDRRDWSKKRRNLDNQEIGDLRGHAEGITSAFRSQT